MIWKMITTDCPKKAATLLLIVAVVILACSGCAPVHITDTPTSTITTTTADLVLDAGDQWTDLEQDAFEEEDGIGGESRTVAPDTTTAANSTAAGTQVTTSSVTSGKTSTVGSGSQTGTVKTDTTNSVSQNTTSKDVTTTTVDREYMPGVW